MELRLIRSFVAVAEELSVTRAARRLNIAQPPLTRQIQQLERELNARLFDRSGRGMALTPAGELLLDDSRALLARVEEIGRRVRRAAAGQAGLLSIGFIESATASGVLGRILTAYRSSHPQVEIVLRELRSLQQAEALRRRQIDVGIVHVRPADATGLAFRTLVSGHLVAAIPTGHPLARGRLTMRRLLDEPLILWPRENSPARYDLIIAQLRASGSEPRVVQHAEQMQTIVGLAAAGVGIGLVPSSFTPSALPGIAYRRVTKLDVRIDMELAWRADDRSPVLRAFLAGASARTAAATD